MTNMDVHIPRNVFSKEYGSYRDHPDAAFQFSWCNVNEALKWSVNTARWSAVTAYTFHGKLYDHR